MNSVYRILRDNLPFTLFLKKKYQQHPRNPSLPILLFLENSTASGLSNEVLWGYIKRKLLVKKYLDNLGILKSADGMVTSNMESFSRRLEMIHRNKGGS